MKQITLKDCWTKIDFTKINKYGVDVYLVDQIGEMVPDCFVDMITADTGSVFEHLMDGFEDWYYSYMLYVRNNNDFVKFTVKSHDTSEETSKAYMYMALCFMIAYIREHAHKHCNEPWMTEIKLKFKNKVHKDFISDIMFNGNNARIVKEGFISKYDNMFSYDYEYATVNTSYQFEDYMGVYAMTVKLVSNSVMDLLRDGAEKSKSEVAKLKKQISKLSDKYDEEHSKYTSFYASYNTIKNKLEADVRNLKKEVDDKDNQITILIDQVMALERENALLKDKNAIYELEYSTPEDKEVAEQLFEDEVQTVDLSNYKIIIVTAEKDKSKFALPTLDLTNSADRMQSLLSCDLVAFDTKHNSHHCYWATKQFCKTNGVKFAHMSCSPASMERELKKFIMSRSI